MKTRRIFAAILVFILCLTAAACGLAAAALKVPSVRFQGIPGRGIESAHSNDIGVNASVPGFLTLWLTHEDDYSIVYRHYFENLEIHSKVNYFNINAFDDNGKPLPAGKYRLHATMVNQYGVETKTEALAKIKIRPSSKVPMSADQIAARAAREAEAAGRTVDAGTAGSAGAAAPESAQQASAPQVKYAAASSVVIGEEGYQIGAGVSDRAADDGSCWSLTADSTDTEIWAALVRPIVSVNVDEKESSYIYDSPYEGRKQIGTVSGLSQGLHVVTDRQDGWSLVEAYRNEDSAFVRGYVKTSRLKSVEVNTDYGIVIDKAQQKLTVYKEGQKVGSCAVCTGLATAKYLARETPAGEFMLVTRRGTVEYYSTNDWCKYAIRINGNHYIAEIPTTRKGGKDYSPMLALLGMKATRGSILVAHDASADGGINAEWIWNMTDKNRKVKVLILDDKDRASVPTGE